MAHNHPPPEPSPFDYSARVVRTDGPREAWRLVLPGPCGGAVSNRDFRSRARGTLGRPSGTCWARRSTAWRSTRSAGARRGGRLHRPAPAHGGAVPSPTTRSSPCSPWTGAERPGDTGAWHPPTDLHRAYRGAGPPPSGDWGPDAAAQGRLLAGGREWGARWTPPAHRCGPRRRGHWGCSRRPRTPRGGRGRRRHRSDCSSAGSRSSSPSSPWSVRRRPTAIRSGTSRRAGTGCHRARAGPGDSLDAAVQRALALCGAAGTPAGQRRARTGAGRRTAGMRLEPSRSWSGAPAPRGCSPPCTARWWGRTSGTGCASPSTDDGPSAAAGALTGRLLGALHGEMALPPAWLAELEGRPTILELAGHFPPWR
ncbi:hypothetical protein TPAU25S_00891 [Tsukamurella paurometabola]